MIAPCHITGLVLAGGRGSRMGGVDKGLQMLAGQPLLAHVLSRLRPQVGPLLINANRNHEAYAAFGLPVLADADASFAGPLAGLLAGLQAADTDWLLSVPCDAPRLPLDLAARLAAALDDGIELVVPVSHGDQLQPVFCLLRCRLQASLSAYLGAGGRKVETWLLAQQHRQLRFDQPGDEAAFFNANSLADLQGLAAHD